MANYELSACVAYGVVDVERATKWYCEVMGFTVRNEGDGWVELKTGALRVFLCKDDGNTPTFELIVEDYERDVKALVEAGCEIVGRREDGAEVYLRDPFGKFFAIEKSSIGASG